MHRISLLLGFVFLGVGCANQGPPEPAGNKVSGMVKLNGAPLKEGTITFVPEKNDGFPAPVSPITDGAYSLKARVGKSKVEIRSPRDSGKKSTTGGAIMEETVPPAYNEKTTLTADVTGETKDLNFDLKK